MNPSACGAASARASRHEHHRALADADQQDLLVPAYRRRTASASFADLAWICSSLTSTCSMSGRSRGRGPRSDVVAGSVTVELLGVVRAGPARSRRRSTSLPDARTTPRRPAGRPGPARASR